MDEKSSTLNYQYKKKKKKGCILGTSCSEQIKLEHIIPSITNGICLYRAKLCEPRTVSSSWVKASSSTSLAQGNLIYVQPSSTRSSYIGEESQKQRHSEGNVLLSMQRLQADFETSLVHILQHVPIPI